MVRGQQEKQRNLIVDVERLKEKYKKLDCPGVIKLIEYLDSERGRKIKELATNTINFGEQTDDEFFGSIMKEGRFPMGISIGNVNRGIRPMQWLAYLAESLLYGKDDISKEQINAFDDICEELVIASMAGDKGEPVTDL